MVFRIAVVGLGKIAMDQHLPCIAKNRNFELVAGVSRHAKVEQVPCFETLSQLRASKIAVDCVALCTPPAVRLALAREVLDYGWHLLIEKPPTPTVGELLAMEAYARKKKRVLYAAWHSRYNKSVDMAKARLKGQHVNFLKVTWKEDVRKWHPGQEWIWQPGGFGVFDPGINALSIVTKILPEPIFADSATIEVPANASTPIAANIRFKRGDGAAADLSAAFDWRQETGETWEIEIGTKSGLALHLKKGGSVLIVNGKITHEAVLHEYEDIYAKFARLLKAKKSEVDASPLQLVSDCFMLGRPVTTAEFS
ncbi:MAG: Gfo/Idh/MocA family oxidoreductase [Rhizobiales bacterium]|nr:Gfo/Idh/MocA family oxidoreductase [Hyphomicrobiales bacterium]MBP9173458.1 Gfo/Idh/MocA family oxidoreductase [Hyphomicrobiales bacterium]